MTPEEAMLMLPTMIQDKAYNGIPTAHHAASAGEKEQAKAPEKCGDILSYDQMQRCWSPFTGVGQTGTQI